MLTIHVLFQGRIQLSVSLQTMLGRAGGLTVLQSRGDRYSVLQGDKLRFGTVETTISYSTSFRQVIVTGLASVAVRHQACTVCCNML